MTADEACWPGMASQQQHDGLSEWKIVALPACSIESGAAEMSDDRVGPGRRPSLWQRRADW